MTLKTQHNFCHVREALRVTFSCKSSLYFLVLNQLLICKMIIPLISQLDFFKSLWDLLWNVQKASDTISWITLIHMLIDSFGELHSTCEVDQLIRLPGNIWTVYRIMLWLKASKMPFPPNVHMLFNASNSWIIYIYEREHKKRDAGIAWKEFISRIKFF